MASSHITSVWILSLELEKEMATHSNVLAWRIPGTGEPDGLLSMGSHRVGHDWSDLAAAAAAHHLMQIDGQTMETVRDFIFLGSKITADCDSSHEIKRHLLLRRKAMTNLDSILKKERCYFANKGPSSQSYGFPSGHVWMWELDYKESWALKNWHFWTVMLEKTLESPLDSKEIKLVNPKGNQPWLFIGRTDDEAGTPILWPPHANRDL